MRMILAAALALLLDISSCTTQPSVIGDYVLEDAPSTTLVISDDVSFRFCEAGMCESGTYELTQPFDGVRGVVRFCGPALERYMVRLERGDLVGQAHSAVAGEEEGYVEMTFLRDPSGVSFVAEITSDRRFVPR